MTDRLATLRPHLRAIAVLLFLCALAAAGRLLFIGTTPNSDYVSYVSTAELFAGQRVPIYPQRVLKPLAPLVVTALAPISGFPAAFLFEVVFFYFAFALVLYWLAYEFFADRRLAVFAALLGALSYPILRYGVDLYTESGAQFFYVLSLTLTLLYLKAPSRRLITANALAIGVGFLWKEYSVVAGIIFGLALLFEALAWRVKIKNLVLLGIVALIPTFCVQLWVYLSYHYTYLDWYLNGGAAGFATQYTPRNLAKSLAALLGLAWLSVPFGARLWQTLSDAQKRFLAVALPAPFVCLAWGYVSSRLFYVIAPAFILLAVLGLKRLPAWMQYVAMALVIFANLAWLVFAST